MNSAKDPFWWGIAGLILLVIGLVTVFKTREMESVPVSAYEELKREPAAGRADEIPPDVKKGVEAVPPNETEQIAQIVELTRKLLQQRYPSSMARRNVHPKDHGCVRGDFTVNQDIPEKYRKGVFAAPGRTFHAWIRFSNATPRVEPDVDGKGLASSRGMAIKLMGVDGRTLFDEPGAKTQDFLMINQPVFTFANVADYLELTRIQLASGRDDVSGFFANPSPQKLRTLDIIKGIRTTPLGNPLEAQYFTAAPFMLGEHTVVKFSARPRASTRTPIPPNPSPDYLREAMKRSLSPESGQPAEFDFLLQDRADSNLPIEDATALWPEETAPFVPVATIHIDVQAFDHPLIATECEHMVFTPWHGLTEHQPLGGINRLRRAVYIASSRYRLEPREPSGYPH
ncbi:MAG: catalase family protein [Methylotetracoccus sp.]